MTVGVMSFGVLCDVVMFDAVMPVADGCWMLVSDLASHHCNTT